VDARLNQPNTQYRVLYSNKATPAAPSAVRQTGTVTVQEVDGGIGNGPLQIIRVVLRPYEVQILGR
jgi:hypothetical protein